MAEDKDAAFEFVRRFLSHAPQNFWELVPRAAQANLQHRQVLEAIVDRGLFFEIGKNTADHRFRVAVPSISSPATQSTMLNRSTRRGAQKL